MSSLRTVYRTRARTKAEEEMNEWRKKRARANMPLEVIEQIANELSQLGNRSAVTAALIHPACTRKALACLREQGIVLSIKTGKDFLNWIDRCESMNKLGMPLPPVKVLRLVTSERIDIMSRNLCGSIHDHCSGMNRDLCDTFEFNGKLNCKETRECCEILGKIKSYTTVRPTHKEFFSSRFQDVEELTLVDVLPFDLERLCEFRQVKEVYAFYTDNDRQATMTIYLRHLFSRPPQQDHPFKYRTDIRNYLGNTKFFFTSVEQGVNRAETEKRVEEKEAYPFQDKRFHCLRYYDADWQERDWILFFQQVNKARDEVKRFMREKKALISINRTA